MRSNNNTARLFHNGGSQAVRLPKEFQFPGDRVRVRRVAGGGVLLEPVLGVGDWFAEMDRFTDEPFMPEGRNQPPIPTRDPFE